MTDVRPLENESSDSELSEGWDIVAQADVCAADVSSDGESVEVLEHEEADSSHAEDGDITQSEGSVEGEPNVEDAESFEEIPSTATDIMSVEGEHATSDMVLFSAEVRKRRQNWLQQSTERPIIVKTMRRYDRQFGQFDNCCLQYGLYLGTLCFCIVVLVFAALVIHFPSRIESNHVASTVKAKDDMTAPDSVKETYQYQNNKKEQIPHVDSKQQSLDTILEEQFKKILAQLESNQKNSLPVLSEGNNQASERKDSYLAFTDNSVRHSCVVFWILLGCLCPFQTFTRLLYQHPDPLVCYTGRQWRCKCWTHSDPVSVIDKRYYSAVYRVIVPD